jgi:ABC-type transport system involved in cytochrome bd biosynthesis fused ATPase/permease subunit
MDVIATLSELARDCSVLLVSHRTVPLHACSKVYELHQGRLIAAAHDPVTA